MILAVRPLHKIVPLSGFVIFALVLGVPSVHADGDDFFAFQLGTNAGTKNSFIGSVKDDRGNFLSGATLTILVKAPSVDEADDSPIDVTFKSFTNVIGRYRTLSADDMVSVINEAAVVLKPEDVELVGVTKAGYKQIQRIDRSRPGRSMREIDFVMKKVDN